MGGKKNKNKAKKNTAPITNSIQDSVVAAVNKKMAENSAATGSVEDKSLGAYSSAEKDPSLDSKKVRIRLAFCSALNNFFIYVYRLLLIRRSKRRKRRLRLRKIQVSLQVRNLHQLKLLRNRNPSQ